LLQQFSFLFSFYTFVPPSLPSQIQLLQQFSFLFSFYTFVPPSFSPLSHFHRCDEFYPRGQFRQNNNNNNINNNGKNNNTENNLRKQPPYLHINSLPSHTVRILSHSARASELFFLSLSPNLFENGQFRGRVRRQPRVVRRAAR